MMATSSCTKRISVQLEAILIGILYKSTEDVQVDEVFLYSIDGGSLWRVVALAYMGRRRAS
jgi:hypothetical protein